MKTSKRFRVRARGPVACFTRPEMKAERVSYEVMTPSAARGVLEAILWKPAIRWQVHEIAVLAPVRWTSFRRNEVNSRAVVGKFDYAADEDRAQRNTVALRDVDYAITASFSLVAGKAGPEDNVRKFEEMFERRLEKGQFFHAPYLGCREFAARVEPMVEDVRPVDLEVERRPLGLVFYDFEFGEATRPLFFEASLDRGVLHVPGRDEVLKQNGGQP
ncbi:type I-C CRISPR-associated protein Cas5c [Myxococcus sp. MISCRS1]|uniref:type I-C CRISPR-associated protein Cas5c n=1 Tax=Myxococcus TaxID=32 RepID=UPI001CBB0171|nr:MULTISPECIES: type I-C CRISPR-associated protein Cas5c [Myxococcus]MBZ4398564.1 type I-C CRISPR-associated protein Cas5c [Myxococcus sp. AS-1-15]MBZ4413542.1 type I-C CRISPR-associated protein Cas5c [Myxococcus sp. XM-1-1-1]MCK8501941.1 type I-C CRISPR-associated protein Cas5c [Myxococcus fulvus]MCY1000239.1 type I-C CRISPR-associated protein Cas5c [Myxococcus sp. MISCRS1]